MALLVRAHDDGHVAGLSGGVWRGRIRTLPLTREASNISYRLYSGEYEAAAALALAERQADRDALAASELRTSALHFAIRRALGPVNTRGKDGEHRDRAWKACTPCDELFSEFLAELHLGRAAARARLAGAPTDAEALFYLGKLNLNYVWLQLGTRGTRTHDLHNSR